MKRLLFFSLGIFAGSAFAAEEGGHAAHEHAEAAPAVAAATEQVDPDAVAIEAEAPAAPAASSEGPAAAAQREEAQGLMRIGASLTERKDFTGAESTFRQILERRGFTADEKMEALLALARLHRSAGNLTKSAAIFQKFLELYPEDRRVPGVMLESGRVLRAMGAYQMAIARFYAVINSTLKVQTGSFDDYQILARTAQFEVAETYFVAGQFAEAGKYFKRVGALELAAVDRARAQFKAAYAQQLGGDLVGAVTSLHTFLEQWPDDESAAEARFLLATTLRKLGRNNEALAATVELLKLAQSQSGENAKRWAYWQRRTGNQLANDFFQGGDIANAQTLYRALAELGEDPAWRLPIVYQIALCEERLGDLPAARQDYTRVAENREGGEMLGELAKMAAWRLQQMNWRTDAVSRLNGLTAEKPVVSPWKPSNTSSESALNSTSLPSPKIDSSNSIAALPTKR